MRIIFNFKLWQLHWDGLNKKKLNIKNLILDKRKRYF